MQTYSEMVDSELAYLGMIPRSWRLTPASMLFNENRQNNQSLISQTPLQFKMGNIIRKNIDVDDKLREEIKRYTVVDKNDIMVNGLNLNYDFATQRVALVGERGCITPAYIALRTRKNYLPRYANYLLKALDGQKVLNGWGTGIRLTLNFTEFKKYRLPEPNTETQEKIADFLDTETAQIDNLIAKQERLLELLEEKRRATITHAVTRGLNPSVELKETNIPWLGQIPAHWKVTKVGFETKFESGGYPLPKNSSEPKTLPWILIGDMRSEFVEGSAGISEKDVQELRLRQTKKGELLFSFKMSIGKVAIASHDMYTTSEIATFYDMRGVSVDYSFYMFPIFIPRNAKKNMMGSDLMNLQLIRQATIVLPPKDEQRKIAEYLKSENLKINKLRQKIKTQIKLLKERRTSLISHVVTGKVMI